MNIKQLSIFMENKSGRLSEIIDLIASAGIDIRALSIADTSDYGILRLIVDNPETAEAACRDAGMTVSITDVIAVGIAHKPGGLAHVLRMLAGVGIGVEYVYAFVGAGGGGAYVILKVDDNARAIDAFRSNGVPLLSMSDILGSR